MIGNGVGIERVVRCRRLDLRDWAAISSRARAMLVLQLVILTGYGSALNRAPG
jgi:hypothetical protein